jgi:hypothetical protein
MHGRPHGSAKFRYFAQFEPLIGLQYGHGPVVVVWCEGAERQRARRPEPYLFEKAQR